MAFWEDEEDMLRDALEQQEEQEFEDFEGLLFAREFEFDDDRLGYFLPEGGPPPANRGRDRGARGDRDAAANGPPQPVAPAAQAQIVINRDIQQIANALEVDMPAEVLRARLDAFLAAHQQAVDSGNGPSAIPVIRVNNRALRITNKTQVKSYVLVMLVLRVVKALLAEGKTATTRDIYYRLKGPFGPIIDNFRKVDQAVWDAAALLNVPRYRLGIVTSARGSVSGSLLLKEGPGHRWTDCSTLPGSDGHRIPGDPGAIRNFEFNSNARYIIVIEKFAVFQRLTEDRIFDNVPCILVTARGVPDVATRAFLFYLTSALPMTPAVALVDWNPHGVGILNTYKFGSRTCAEAFRFRVPALQWLGARWAMLDRHPEAAFQPLVAADHRMLRGLQTSSPIKDMPQWLFELRMMERGNKKAEIEAVAHFAAAEGPMPDNQAAPQAAGSLSAVVVQAMLHQHFI